MDNIKVGDFLKSLRKAKGFTQEEVADELMVSSKTISRWECGDGLPDISIISSVADLYGVSVDEILKGERRIKDEGLKEESIALKNKNKDKLIVRQALSKFDVLFYISLGSVILLNLVAFIFAFFNRTIIAAPFVSLAGILVSFILLAIGKFQTNEIIKDNEDIIDDKVKRTITYKIVSKSFFVFDNYIASGLISIYVLYVINKYSITSTFDNIFRIINAICLLCTTYLVIRILIAKYKNISNGLSKAFTILSFGYIIYALFFGFNGMFYSIKDLSLEDDLLHALKYFNPVNFFVNPFETPVWYSYLILGLGLLGLLSSVVLQFIFIRKKKMQFSWITYLVLTLSFIILMTSYIPAFILSKGTYNVNLLVFPTISYVIILIMIIVISIFKKKEQAKN